MENDDLRKFYDQMDVLHQTSLGAFVFVYNDYSTYVDDPHLEECFSEEDKNEVIDAVYDLFSKVYSYPSESEFIQNCEMLKSSFPFVYVYSMAQKIEGYARRSLVPALCLQYGFININADVYMSVIGCNKETMFRLLISNNILSILPPTLFFGRQDHHDLISASRVCGESIVIKPISESCCIDVNVFFHYSNIELSDAIGNLLNKYQRCMIQKYIYGEEIGITVMFHHNRYYVFNPIAIKFTGCNTHLTHEDSFHNNYSFSTVSVPQDLLDICIDMSKCLGFQCIARYDFRYDGQSYYLIDISPNPTLSDFSSCNLAVRTTLKTDYRGIFRLMVYSKLSLFEPSFYCSVNE